MWQAVQGLSGQVNVLSDMAGRTVLGWDIVAALTLAEAHGVPRPVAAEFLPPLETMMVRNLRDQDD